MRDWEINKRLYLYKNICMYLLDWYKMLLFKTIKQIFYAYKDVFANVVIQDYNVSL
jgi:hypothetical protein